MLSPLPSLLPNRFQGLGLLVLILALGLVWWLRIGWIEDTVAGFACVESGEAICVLRHTIVQGFHWHVFGWAAIAVGLFALVKPQLGWAAATLALSALALLLYNTDQGAVALVLGLIALGRATPKARAG